MVNIVEEREFLSFLDSEDANVDLLGRNTM
jgi:hypothetical protein